MTKYTLIVGHDFCLSNETDADVQSDYFPGIWAIKTQKSALKFARQILEEGNEIRVSDYDNPKYHALANQFIKELGLKQYLFKEVEALKQEQVTNGKPSTLGALKKYLVTGTKVKIQWFDNEGKITNERETFVKRTQTNAWVFDKNGSDSWLEHGKASEWVFSNDGATLHYIDRDGTTKPSVKLIYINQ